MSRPAEVAVSNVYVGTTVICSESEYRSEVREALQNFAAKSINSGDHTRAQIALCEISRLDKKFGGPL